MKKIFVRFKKLQSIIHNFVLKSLGVTIGKNCYISSNFKVYDFNKLVIGDNIFINDYFWCNAKGGVKIGNDVLIGPNVTIHSSNHNFSKEGVFRLQGHTNKEVVIGSNVWLCASVVVLPGVKISDNIVVGAGSVVTKDLMESGVYGGVPAKYIKGL